MKNQKCAICESDAYLKGWFYEHKGTSFGRGKKIYKIWCREHYLIHMFNLWPFTCTKTCRERHSKRIGVEISKKDQIVWIGLESALVPAVKNPNYSKSIPMKSLAPKCPWCGKSMILLSEFLKY
jgi:hypothetical protein